MIGLRSLTTNPVGLGPADGLSLDTLRAPQSARRARRAQALGLNIEWEHWGDVAAYPLIIDSGVEFDVRD